MARSRRSRGEHGIYQRESDGLWVGSLSLGYDEHGKRKRRVVYGDSKRSVYAKLDELRASARVGTLTDATGLTVAQLLGQFLKATAAKRSPRTSEEWERLTKNHLRPRLGSVRLDKLSALHVEGLYAEMHADGVGAFTIRAAADVLSIALNYALRMKLIPANPSSAVKKPKLPKREMHFLDDAQARLLVDVGRAVQVGPLVTVALASGCRQGELLALGWEDFDMRAGTLRVRKALSVTKSGPILKEPKTDASRRTVTLPTFAVEVLAKLKADALKNGLLQAPVFCTRGGGYLDKKNVLRAFKSLVKRANKTIQGETVKPIPEKVRFHDLRHTVASLLLSKGASLRAVATRLGHANPTMTLRVYGHTMPGDDAKLADGLQAVMG